MNDTGTAAPIAPEAWHPAGFWIRLLADIVDSMIVLFPASFIAGFVTSLGGGSRFTLFLVSNSLTILVGASYYTLLTGGAEQTTWGKKIFDIKVVGEDGSRIGYGQAFLRWCAYLPSYLTLCFGFMMAGWNQEKIALHDYIAGTRVVRKGAASAAPNSSVWKIVGAIAGVGVVLAMLLAAGGILWLKQNRGKIQEQGQAVTAEGKSFGEKTSQDACVAEAVSRLANAGILNQALDRMFLRGCLPAASLSPGFCENVPPTNSILATVGWRIQRCEKLGHVNDQPCGRLMEAVQDYCFKTDAQKTEAPPSR